MDDCCEWCVNWDFSFGEEQRDLFSMQSLDEQISVTDGNVFLVQNPKSRICAGKKFDNWSQERKFLKEGM